MASEPVDRRLLIKNLVQQGGLKHPNPGQYFSEDASSDFKSQFPVYDLTKLRAAFPDALEVDIQGVFDDETGEQEELLVVLKDGRTDITVKLDKHPPATVEGLIEKIHSHLRSVLNLDSLRETEGIFDDALKDD